jgi:hypothetical protein
MRDAKANQPAAFRCDASRNNGVPPAISNPAACSSLSRRDASRRSRALVSASQSASNSARRPISIAGPETAHGPIA